MGLALKLETYYSVSDYFKIDTKGKLKYEYYFGEVSAMAGGTVRHSKIAFNVQMDIAGQIQGRSCEILNSDVRVEVVENDIYTYPDLVLSCDKEDISDDNTLLKRPSLIVEILSKSTSSFDLNEKLNYYLKMPSLLYYLIIDQNRCNILCYERKEEGKWELQIYDNVEDVIILSLLDLQIKLGATYHAITFPITKTRKQ